MKNLLEVIHGNVSAFMNPSTLVLTQVVQPQTRQYDDPAQGIEYDKVKNKNKNLEKIDTKEYNKKDDITDDDYEQKYVEAEDDGDIMNFLKKLNKTIEKDKKDDDTSGRFYRKRRGTNVGNIG